MKLILFGATGMVGSGALREALKDPDVEKILSIGRRPCGVTHPKLQELFLNDLFNPKEIENKLSEWDACV
jgi:putative NADH-flavin reductase